MIWPNDPSSATWPTGRHDCNGDARIVEMFPTGKTDKSWKPLVGGDAAAAHRVLAALLHDPRQAMKLATANLRPAPALDRSRIQKAIDQFADSDFATREKASAALTAEGSAINSILRAALEKATDAEVRQRLQRVLTDIERSPGQLNPEERIALRGVELLERLETYIRWLKERATLATYSALADRVRTGRAKTQQVREKQA